MHLHLDFETRSKLDIGTAGLDNYARNCEPLMLAWACADVVEPRVWFPPFSDDSVPHAFPLAWLTNPSVIKCAWNKEFEQAVLRYRLDIDVPDSQWLDPAVLARHAGLPGKLKLASEALNLGAEGKDHEAGTTLINFFSKPIAAGNKKGQFRNPADHPERWLAFQEYCKQDVIAERAVLNRLQKFPLSEKERRVWLLDQKINQRGWPVSRRFVDSALHIVSEERSKLLTELKALTGLANPNSGKQLLPWLQARGYTEHNLRAATVRDTLKGQ